MRASVHASLFLFALLLCAPADGLAQDRPQSQRPDTARVREPMQAAEDRQQAQEMQQMQQQVRAMMTATVQTLTQSTMATLAEPETAENLAKFVRNYYQALVAQGFSREEALRIVSSVGLPALPSL